VVWRRVAWRAGRVAGIHGCVVHDLFPAQEQTTDQNQRHSRRFCLRSFSCCAVRVFEHLSHVCKCDDTGLRRLPLMRMRAQSGTHNKYDSAIGTFAFILYLYFHLMRAVRLLFIYKWYARKT
jgi:hypothetical protein